MRGPLPFLPDWRNWVCTAWRKAPKEWLLQSCCASIWRRCLPCHLMWPSMSWSCTSCSSTLLPAPKHHLECPVCKGTLTHHAPWGKMSSNWFMVMKSQLPGSWKGCHCCLPTTFRWGLHPSSWREAFMTPAAGNTAKGWNSMLQHLHQQMHQWSQHHWPR